MPPPLKPGATPAKGGAGKVVVPEAVIEVAVAAPVIDALPPAAESEASRGRFVFDDGSIYEGDFLFTRANGLKKRHGQGRFMGKHFSYEGGWGDDTFHGMGNFISADGASFVGGFDAGAFHGPGGKYKFTDGASYEGGWFRNLMHGPGHYVTPDGVLFAGDFHLGLYVRGKSHVAVR